MRQYNQPRTSSPSPPGGSHHLKGKSRASQSPSPPSNPQLSKGTSPALQVPSSRGNSQQSRGKSPALQERFPPSNPQQANGKWPASQHPSTTALTADSLSSLRSHMTSRSTNTGSDSGSMASRSSLGFTAPPAAAARVSASSAGAIQLCPSAQQNQHVPGRGPWASGSYGNGQPPVAAQATTIPSLMDEDAFLADIDVEDLFDP